MGAEISSLHVPFESWLRSRGIEFLHSRPDREATVEKGTADFVCLFPDRPPLFVELKWEKGKESADQVRVRERLVAKGFKCFVIRQLQAAIELVTQWQSDVGPAPVVEPRNSMVIRQRGTMGDWLFSGDKPVRPASLGGGDYKAYKRE